MNFGPTVHIFISYAKKDTRYRAIYLDAIFDSLSNVTAWMDKELNLVEDWADQIQKELDRADLVVILISEDVNRTTLPPSFVKKEIARAQEKHIPLIVIMAQATDVPITIQTAERLDFTTSNIDLSLNRLITFVCQQAKVDLPSPERLNLMKAQAKLAADEDKRKIEAWLARGQETAHRQLTEGLLEIEDKIDAWRPWGEIESIGLKLEALVAPYPELVQILTQKAVEIHAAWESRMEPPRTKNFKQYDIEPDNQDNIFRGSGFSTPGGGFGSSTGSRFGPTRSSNRQQLANQSSPARLAGPRPGPSMSARNPPTARVVNTQTRPQKTLPERKRSTYLEFKASHNPVNWFRLLWGMLMDPATLLSYRMRDEKYPLYIQKTGSWLFSTLLFGLLLIPTVATAIGYIPMNEIAQEWGWGLGHFQFTCTVILSIWLFTNLATYCESYIEVFPISFLILIIVALVALTVVCVIVGVSVTGIIVIGVGVGVIISSIFGTYDVISVESTIIGLIIGFIIGIAGTVGGGSSIGEDIAGDIGSVVGGILGGLLGMVSYFFVVVLLGATINSAIKSGQPNLLTRAYFFLLVATYPFLIWVYWLGGWRVLGLS